MILSLVQSPPTSSLFPHNPKLRTLRLRPATNPLFRTTLLPRLDSPNLARSITNKHRPGTAIHASWVGDLYSMAEIFRVSPAGQLLWNAARLFGVFYLFWLCLSMMLSISNFFGGHYPSDPETKDFLYGWFPTVKGGLQRMYFVKSATEGQRAPEVFESFFSEDDHFKDCGIRWGKNFFGEEYICCNNVTGTFRESEIHIEIAPCPLGKGEQYINAVKLEKVLRGSFACSDLEMRIAGFCRYSLRK